VNWVPAVALVGTVTRKLVAVPGLTVKVVDVPVFAKAVTVSEVVSAL
jgi:hypothetical protein